MEAVTPNIVAYAALAIWPIVSVFLFATKPTTVALIWTILGAHLLLPVGTVIKLPMIPAFDKESIPNLCALVGCAFFAGRAFRRDFKMGLAEVLLAGMLIGPFVTSLLNTDPIVVSEKLVLDGVGYYDAGSAVTAQAITLIPFFLGRRYLRAAADNENILRALTIGGLLYVLPILFEIRMSPQLHSWIYGYFPHQFFQQMRDGGFRAVVFLGHGLLVSFFMMTSMLASAALWRARIRVWQLPPQGVTAGLSVVLLLCKSLGSLLYGAAGAPIVLLAKPRLQAVVAVFLASAALAYPMLRTFDLVPTEGILGIAESVSADRAASLKVRFDNERDLLDHASNRIWFGWGRYGRGRVFDEQGVDRSLTDGEWIIRISTFGVLGFVAQFGLLALPVFRSLKVIRSGAKIGDGVIILTALSLITAIGMVDLIPNASLNPISWLIAGSLLGWTDALRATGKSVSDRSIVRLRKPAILFTARQR